MTRRLLPLGFGSTLFAFACAESSPPPSAPITVDVPVANASASPASSASPPAPAAASAARAEDAAATDPDGRVAAKANMWGDAIGSYGAADAGAAPAVSSHGGSPSMRQGATQVTGRLPPEVIQRIVRQQFGRLRLCYENGLRTTPTLRGRVVIKFVIDPTGAVKSAADGGSDLPDAAVVDCVKRAFAANLLFPQPEGNSSVTVVYPLIFEAGTAAPATSAKPAPAKRP